MDLTTSHVIVYTDKSKFASTYLDCSLSIIDYISIYKILNWDKSLSAATHIPHDLPQSSDQ